MSIISQTFCQPAEALWCHVFQSLNTTWLFEQRIISGNFFLGLQGQTVQLFRANIPKNAIIESAVMRVTAFSSTAFPYSTNLNTPTRSGNIYKKTVGRVGELKGWRHDLWSNGDFHVRDIASATIADTPGGVTNQFWTLRQVASLGGQAASTWRDRMAQLFVPATGATLGSIDAKLSRNGSPLGNVRLRIMGAVSELGQMVPNETVLATSDVRTLASIATVATDETFVFSGVNQVTLNAGQSYFVVLEPDQYNADNINNVSLYLRHAFFTVGKLWHYGTDRSLRWQHYPGTVDVNQAHLVGQIGTDIPWNVPSFATGLSYDTPDITALVQAQVDDADYDVSERVIVITTGGNAGFANRVWRSPAHPQGPAPRLTVTYRVPPGEILEEHVHITDVSETTTEIAQLSPSSHAHATLVDERVADVATLDETHAHLISLDGGKVEL